MNILYLSSHAILEYDQLRLWTGLGHDVFSIGAYTNPHAPEVKLRPAVPAATNHADLAALCHAQRVLHADDPAGYPIIDWAKADLHPDLIDWADTVIVDCYPESWIPRNWGKFGGKRVIWRTIGQSGPQTEMIMRTFRARGMEIVRYSPAEQRAFRRLGVFAGEDALIRFGKDPADYGPWIPTGTASLPAGFEAWDTGHGSAHGQVWGPYIANLAQHEPDNRRDPFLNWQWVEAATEGLPFLPAGPNSEQKGGLGELDYDSMRQYLARARAYIYSGTQPASYTLGLMEAMMTGVPVVSIGKGSFGQGDLFEGDEIVGWGFDDPTKAAEWLRRYLTDRDLAATDSQLVRSKADYLFGTDTIGQQWADFFDCHVADVERRLAGAAA